MLDQKADRKMGGGGWGGTRWWLLSDQRSQRVSSIEPPTGQQLGCHISERKKLLKIQGWQPKQIFGKHPISSIKVKSHGVHDREQFGEWTAAKKSPKFTACGMPRRVHSNGFPGNRKAGKARGRSTGGGRTFSMGFLVPNNGRSWST